MLTFSLCLDGMQTSPRLWHPVDTFPALALMAVEVADVEKTCGYCSRYQGSGAEPLPCQKSATFRSIREHGRPR
jgi:hypothetical protein